MERIGVTHAGSLIRPPELLAVLASLPASDHDQAAAGPEYQAALGSAVDYVVRRQVETGIDIVDDGEMGKATWITYLYERTTGLESRQLTGSFSTMLPASRDRQNFPGAYAELDRLEHDATVRFRDEAAGGVVWGAPSTGASVWVCTGPMSYDRAAIDRDLANFKAALARNGKDITEAFLPVVAPASTYWLQNEHYNSDEEFVYALADVLHEEYKAIVESGAFLQVDDAVLMHEADTMLSRGQSYEEYRAWARLRVDALNHALRGLPEDRIRYHICFGSWHGPHAYDPPLRDSIDLVLAVNAKYYLMEQANPRHEHEWKIWQDVELPDGKVLVPGVVTHHTNVVEHPELVAQRLTRLANVVGRDRVMGGTDCGFAQGAFMHRVHEEIQWAKLASLVEGARIASRELWGAKAELLSYQHAMAAHSPPVLTNEISEREEMKLRINRRAGSAGAVAVVAAALTIAGCSSSSSSSASAPTSTSPTAAATSAPASTPASSPAAAASGTVQAGTSVTNYLSYVGGKAGPANSSLPPVTIGFVNEQGDANPPGPLSTVGAQMAVTYINKELGGVDGHPLKLDTCFTTTEQQGTSCAQQLLAAKVPLIATGGVAVGAQSLLAAINGQVPVIDGVAATPFDAVSKNTFILFGDATHVLGPMGTYANMIGAKTATVIYPQNPGIIAGAQAVQKGLQAAGVKVTMEGYPETATSLTQYLVAGHASTADMVVPYADAASCVNLAKALTALNITNPKKIVTAPLCLSGTVIKGLGDFPKWTYSIASSNYGDPTDPGMPAYEAVTKKYTTIGNAVDPWVIVNFGEMLTVDKFLNEVGYANISASTLESAAKAFKGPQALGAPALDCGSFPTAPAVCNDRAQFFQYMGKNVFTKVAGWLQPVTPSS